MAFLRAIGIGTLALLAGTGSALAQDDCPSCRSNNFYYILALAIGLFVLFFWWANRNRPPKVSEKSKSEEQPDDKEG